MNRCKRLAALCLLAVIFTVSGGAGKAKASARPSYLKSVTYFSDEWAINFWSTESPHMEEELAQIKEDGFNSIILVLPWREFQPDIYRPEEYNEYALEKLESIMDAADRHGLWVTVRLGYTWDYYDTQNVLLRFENILSDHQTRNAWMKYAEAMYQTLSAYPNFYGGFMTWEDFWGFMENAFSINEGYDAKKKAELTGYTKYLREHYGLDEISGLYGSTISRYSDIAFPKRDTPAAWLVYEWYDEFLNDLLSDTQNVFPGLSMEVRLDQDPVYKEDGNRYPYSHEKTYGCGSSPYTSAMISVPMGQANIGEKTTAAAAVRALDGVISAARARNGGKLMYFEQFLYVDNTEQFSYNAQVKDEELPSFITAMAPVLKKHGMGYGLWVYRDYAENVLYNPQFAVGLRGWSSQNGVTVETREGTPMARLSAGSTLKQKLHGSVSGGEGLGCSTVSFRAVSEEPATVTVSLGNASQTAEINGDQRVELSFYGASGGTLTFESDGVAYIDDVKAYRHVQQAQCRDLDGSALRCLPAVQALNRALGN